MYILSSISAKAFNSLYFQNQLIPHNINYVVTTLCQVMADIITA